MKSLNILIVNKFLYPRGGDCICTLNLRSLLEKEGHKVTFFSMDYPENLEYPESKYFAKEISFDNNLKGKIKASTRIIWGIGVKKKFQLLLDKTKPDIVHLNNIHSYLSPIVAKLAYQNNIKVVWTLHDYKLICPTYSFLCHGNICEACMKNKLSVISNRCMKNSTIASFLAYIESIKWNQKKLCKWTNAFVCPSQYMANKMKEGGYPESKLYTICNSINDSNANFISSAESVERKNAYCYVGRLSKEKGIDILLTVAAKLPFDLYIAGTGPEEIRMREQYQTKNIHFLGQLTYDKVLSLLTQVLFSVVPSIWYENNPLSVIESLCCGTPVLGSRIGGIPEMLIDPYSELFTLDTEEELKTKIIRMFNKCKTIDNKQLSQASISRFSEKEYYTQLINIYQND